MARSIGAVHLDTGLRDVWGLRSTARPHEGSAYVEYGFGLPPDPACNLPQTACEDPHGKLRNLAAARQTEPPTPKQLEMFLVAGSRELPATSPSRLDEQLREPSPTRLCWALLLARVFRIDVTVCSRCGGPMRILAAVTHPDDIAAHLHGNGVHARGPPRPHPPGHTLLFPA